MNYDTPFFKKFLSTDVKKIITIFIKGVDNNTADHYLAINKKYTIQDYIIGILQVEEKYDWLINHTFPQYMHHAIVIVAIFPAIS